MSLETHLLNCVNAGELNYVDRLLGTRSSGTVSFWGTRFVEVFENDTLEWINLDGLAHTVNTLASKVRDGQSMSPENRLAGLEVVRKIEWAYKSSDIRIRYSNLLTRFFVWIRELYTYFIPYTTRFFLEETAFSDLKTYSREEFIRLFGEEKGANNEYVHADSGFEAKQTSINSLTTIMSKNVAFLTGD